MLKSNLEINEKKAVVHLQGRADTLSSECVFTSYEKAKAEGCNEIEFDMQGVEYICSATLRAFLKSQKDCNKNGFEMYVTGASDGVKDVFELTSFSSIINIS
ncbi:MAG: STAS domain-containing protein [Clostridiales bacterium]|nr:STAS domain-containing protein [Clostridiales bacterium]